MMTATKTERRVIAPHYTGPRLFGTPVGDFSVLQTLLMTIASGFVAFFITTFLAIMTMLVLTQVLHHNLDFAIAYRWFGFPVGCTVFVIAGVYLGTLLVRRLTKRG